MTANKALPTRAHTRDLVCLMIRIRRFGVRCAELYTQQKIRGFLHLHDGQEAIADGVIPVLRPADRIVATRREHGHALARGVPITAIMAEMHGKAPGCSGGRGGSMQLFEAKAGYSGGNAIVGGGLPLAAGLAPGDRLQEDPEPDSMDMLPLVTALHARLGIDIPEADCRHIATQDRAAAYLAGRAP